MNTVRVAIAQAEVAPNLEAGLEKTRTLARAAAATGAQLVAFEGRCFEFRPIRHQRSAV